jgi:hypothetical protein
MHVMCHMRRRIHACLLLMEQYKTPVQDTLVSTPWLNGENKDVDTVIGLF